MKESLAETLQKQSDIIRIQSGIIDKLALSLLQYTQLEEATLGMMMDAAMKRQEIGE